MSVRVRGGLRDLLAAAALPLRRAVRMRLASCRRVGQARANALADALHPQALSLTVTEVRRETADARTYRLGTEGRRLPPFRAGQYLSVGVQTESGLVFRPFSICSSPREADQEDYYEITVRRKPDGFASRAVWDGWDRGTPV